MSQTRHKYTPDEMTEAEFLAGFAVRKSIFERIYTDIATADYSVPQQHYIIIGQRGQGKTTLLRRIKIACLQDEKLSKKLIPVKFSEEQYQIRSLVRLWEEVADTLYFDYPALFPGLIDRLDKLSEESDYPTTCFTCLDEAVRHAGKNILLLIDNIDQLFDKLSLKEQRTLREILTVSPFYRIIGGSTKMLEYQFDYSKPFYEFFRIEKLTGLTSNECVDLLRALAGESEKETIETIISQNPQRIELLRRLTGGVPRTMVMLFDIFMDETGNAFQDLMKVLDEVTPLYKHRMDDLPPQLQDIMHAVAMNWDGISVKEIAKQTGLATNAISAQLNKLEKTGIVYSEAIGKNKVYQINERFFNIWYLMRFGRKRDRQRVEWLVKFLESWCTPEELKSRAKNLMDLIKTGKTLTSHVFHMTEALCYSGLDAEMEDSLKRSARGYLKKCDPELCREISPSDSELFKKANVLLDNKNFNDALKVVLQIKRENGQTLNLVGILYAELKNNKEAEKYFLLAAKKGHVGALYNIAILYQKQQRYVEAEKHYLLAIEKGQVEALNNLANLYKDQQKFAEAEKYYLRAIDKGNINALFNIAILYVDQQKYADAEKYYLRAIDKGNINALFNIAILYHNQQKYAEAEKYYLLAIKKGDIEALNNIANLYDDQQKFARAEEYYLRAIEKNAAIPLNNYALFLYDQATSPEKALSHITRSISQIKNYYNLHTYALIQLWNDQFSESHTTFTDWLQTYKDTAENDHIIEYLTLLLAKKQLHRAKTLFELPEYQLKGRFKPFWYALARLMGDEMKTESAKMGRELEESVMEILARVNEYQGKYQ
jgi:TPR repeat protein/DNA-binding transcriptional regulator GbsR (MarR family)